MKAYKAILVLEDGQTYYGWSFCKSLTSIGEVVFNTGMTGYQEVMTDPSYSGQIINFTYPEIGNTGINHDDTESIKPLLQGIITKNISIKSSNWRENQSLITYLQDNKIMHIYGIDTRKLTKHLRNCGTMYGCISTQVLNPKSIQCKVKQGIKNQKDEFKNIVLKASTTTSYQGSNIKQYFPTYSKSKKLKVSLKKDFTIVVVDFGAKNNIIRNLSKYVNKVIIVPANIDITKLLEHEPDGVLLSNGPGDPKNVTYVVKTIKQLIDSKVPIFGICMGHQIMSIALGLNTFKLKFGHRGLNHPIGLNKNIEISSQNHGYAIQKGTSQSASIIVNQFNFNDQTIAAISHKLYPSFSVQYHPEASPGPHDSENLFLHFIRVIQICKKYPQIL